MDRKVWIAELYNIYDLNGATTHTIYDIYASKDSAMKKAEEYMLERYEEAHLDNDSFEYEDKVNQILHIADVRSWTVKD